MARNQYRSEFQAWQARERRREIMHRLVKGAGLIAAAVLIAAAMYASLIGFYVIAGCIA